jgi:mercuric ion transport protein
MQPNGACNSSSAVPRAECNEGRVSETKEQKERRRERARLKMSSSESSGKQDPTCSVSHNRSPNPWWLVGGSVVSAVVASACCVGPLVLAVLGLGGAAALVKLSPLRPFLVLLTLLLLAGGLTLAYRRPRAAPEPSRAASGAECACARPRARTAGRVALWVLAALILVLLVSPYAIPAVLG